MNPMNTNIRTVDDYIAQFPDDVQAVLRQVRKTIKEAAPQAEETISYAMPTFKLNGNLVHFAGYKRHIGFYPAPTGIEQFKDEISAYKWAKGSLQFPLTEPIPFDLIRRIVLFRVSENVEKKKSSKKALKLSG